MSQSTIPEPSWKAWFADQPIRLGVSSCLLGAEVRYDGGHKRDPYLTDVLGDWFDWVPFCPELEIGLGAGLRLVEPVSGKVLTERMERFAERRLRELKELDVDGFILKSRSPSCGLEDVEIVDKAGTSSRDGVGIFARFLVERWPEIPAIHEEQITDLSLRTAFFEYVLGRHRHRVTAGRFLDAERTAERDAAYRAILEMFRAKGSE
jgi:uncharacterized protein YbbK (DUF523 family)